MALYDLDCSCGKTSTCRICMSKKPRSYRLAFTEDDYIAERARHKVYWEDMPAEKKEAMNAKRRKGNK